VIFSFGSGLSLRMIIWILALLILSLVAIVGYYQGFIRVAFSLAGLIVSSILAVPLSGLGRWLLSVFGMTNPLLLQIFGPVLVFLAVLVLFKISAFSLDRKVDYIYKYRKSDYERMKFERLNARVGFLLGLFNGAVYFLILLIPFYVFGYLTVQVASGEESSGGLKFVNQMRQAIQSSRMDKVLAGMDPAPREFYEASDVIGLVKNNPQLQNRLSQYPSLVTIIERPELQELVNDPQLAEMVQRQTSLTEILEQPKIKALMNNQSVWEDVKKLGTDLRDLQHYLQTGVSEKFKDSPFLGRWNLDIDQTLGYSKRKRQAMSNMEYNQIRNMLMTLLQNGVLTLTTEGKLSIRSRGTGGPDEAIQTVSEGTWSKEGNSVTATLVQAAKSEKGEISMDSPSRLLLTRGGMVMVFNKPD